MLAATTSRAHHLARSCVGAFARELSRASSSVPTPPRPLVPSRRARFSRGPSRRSRALAGMAATADVGTHSSSAIVAAAESFVREELSAMDGSHDWWHVDRVRKTALSLAAEERVPVASLEVVELAALLHDVRDWKYSGDRDAGERAVRAFLERHAYDPERLEAVVDIVANVGFKNELPSDDDDSPSPGGSTANATRSPEFRVVQDADRLDAMGAIGIARTFCYGGAKKNPMHVPGVEPRVEMTRAQYEAAQRGGGGEEDGGEARPNTVVNHFHEKLLTLRGLMKSDAGRRRAEKRHETMLQFLKTFHAEWDGVE